MAERMPPHGGPYGIRDRIVIWVLDRIRMLLSRDARDDLTYLIKLGARAHALEKDRRKVVDP